MLPAGTIAGWVLVIMTPVYAVFFVFALILVQHLAGNGICSRRRVAGGQSVRPPHGGEAVHVPAHDRRRGAPLDRVQRTGGAVGAAGMVMILIWAFTATVGAKRIVGGGDALLDPLGAVLAALELVARMLGDERRVQLPAAAGHRIGLAPRS